MPKSKKRKNRYVPKPKPIQQTTTSTSAVQTAERPPAKPPTTSTTTLTSSPAKTRTIEKTQPVPQTINISTEMRLIGIITVVLIAAIVILYFIFR